MQGYFSTLVNRLNAAPAGLLHDFSTGISQQKSELHDPFASVEEATGFPPLPPVFQPPNPLQPFSRRFSPETNFESPPENFPAEAQVSPSANLLQKDLPQTPKRLPPSQPEPQENQPVAASNISPLPPAVPDFLRKPAQQELQATPMLHPKQPEKAQAHEPIQPPADLFSAKNTAPGQTSQIKPAQNRQVEPARQNDIKPAPVRLEKPFERTPAPAKKEAAQPSPNPPASLLPFATPPPASPLPRQPAQEKGLVIGSLKVVVMPPPAPPVKTMPPATRQAQPFAPPARLQGEGIGLKMRFGLGQL